jgi:hypothetical protein
MQPSALVSKLKYFHILPLAHGWATSFRWLSAPSRPLASLAFPCAHRTHAHSHSCEGTCWLQEAPRHRHPDHIDAQGWQHHEQRRHSLCPPSKNSSKKKIQTILTDKPYKCCTIKLSQRIKSDSLRDMYLCKFAKSD